MVAIRLANAAAPDGTPGRLLRRPDAVPGAVGGARRAAGDLGVPGARRAGRARRRRRLRGGARPGGRPRRGRRRRSPPACWSRSPAPMARVLPRRGLRATPGRRCADTIVAFAPGLVGYGLVALLTRALYARGLWKAPTVVRRRWLAGRASLADVVAVRAAARRPTGRSPWAPGTASASPSPALALLVVVARVAGAGALAGVARAGGPALAGAVARRRGRDWPSPALLGADPVPDGGRARARSAIGLLAGAVVLVVAVAVMMVTARARCRGRARAARGRARTGGARWLRRGAPARPAGSSRCSPPARAASAPTCARCCRRSDRRRARRAGLRRAGHRGAVRLHRRRAPTSAPVGISAGLGAGSPTAAPCGQLRRATAGADLVHAHGLRAGLVAAAARRLAGERQRPLVLTLHNALQDGAGRAAAAAAVERPDHPRRRPGARRLRRPGRQRPPARRPRRPGGPGRRAAAAAGRARTPRRASRRSSASTTAGRWSSRSAGCTRRRATTSCSTRSPAGSPTPRLRPAPLVAIAGDGPLHDELAARIRAERLPVVLLGRRDRRRRPARRGRRVRAALASGRHARSPRRRRCAPARRWSPPRSAASPSWSATPRSWCRSATPAALADAVVRVLTDPARAARAGRRRPRGRRPAGPTRRPPTAQLVARLPRAARAAPRTGAP